MSSPGDPAALTAADYTGSEAFQRERRHLFAAEWLPFCAVAQLAETGAFVSHSLCGFPLVALRGGDGGLRVLRNVCRHQAMPVVEQAAGRCTELRCRYHGWTYDLAGSFITAPAPVAPGERGAERTDLQQVTAAEGGALVFIHLATPESRPPVLEPGGAPFAAALTVDVDANWKSCVEAILLDPAWRFIWPLAFVAASGGGRIMRQIVPRSFLRTRIVDHVFAQPDEAASMREARVAATQLDKAAAEATQALRRDGSMTCDSAAIARFREEVAKACRG